MTPRARVLLFTGDGKGKTTAALGLVVRAAGHGMRARIIQFIKSHPAGEVNALQRFPEVEIMQTGRGFVPPEESSEFAAHVQAAQAGLRLAAETLESDAFGVVVLDEICNAVSKRLIDEEAVLDLIRKARPDTILVLTGRGSAGTRIAEAADTVSEIKCVKHGKTAGWPAQEGVEL